MDVLHIHGGSKLAGNVQVSGAKNAALPIFAAALLSEETCTIENVPDLSDIRFMAGILRHMGADVEQPAPGTWRITARKLNHVAPYDLVRKMRASICLLGPLVARLRKAYVSMPGGCVIGPRPIDLHLKGLAALGCQLSMRGGYMDIDAANLSGGYVYLGGRHGPTVTGTANIVMAAVLAPGISRIESAACEPEIVDLCNMLVAMGAHIEGIGSHYLKITGVKALRGCTHKVVPDRIEAGTFLVAGAMTKSDLTVNGLIPGHMRALLDKLEEAGVPCTIEPDAKRITVHGTRAALNPVELITLPHPGFPTDLQAQFCAMMSLTPGLSVITERIYPNRYMHVPELLRMGANIAIEGANAVVKGVKSLSGAPVMASDLRASAALVLAGLAANGETWVQRIYHLDRGYEKLENKLAALGATINRMHESEMPKELLDDA
ncbi:MAG: UDP-N-acetylglucosamine 1-carboxyvinyltransferase [Verrucomicrobia bacterium]|nr:UDP-N-acetylglucosamine 1-carboxyvinyltransferase [Verrucomicrobiota bacterium]